MWGKGAGVPGVFQADAWCWRWKNIVLTIQNPSVMYLHYKTSIYQSNRNIWHSLKMYLNRQSMLEKLPDPNMQTIRAPSWPRELIGGKKRPSLSFPGRRAPSPIDGLPPFSLFLFQHLKTSMLPLQLRNIFLASRQSAPAQIPPSADCEPLPNSHQAGVTKK